jgi:hypothetical protein
MSTPMQWTSVADSLPNDGEGTLCFGPGLDYFIAEFGCYPSGGGSWVDEGGEVWFPNGEVTHWCRLTRPE